MAKVWMVISSMSARAWATILVVSGMLLIAGLLNLIPRSWAPGTALAMFGVAGGVAVAAVIHELSASPSQDRPWRADVARLATAEIDGDLVTVHNVRNFGYRGPTEFEERWETRRYDLGQLERVDVFLSYWGRRAMAHSILSFAFADGQHLAVSVEVRRSVDREFSVTRSLFQRFEIVYVMADERDVIGVRAHQREEDVYLFPLRLDPPRVRVLFVDILRRLNELATTPDFYRTVRGNCTTSLVRHFQAVADDSIRFSLRLVLNGFLPALLHDRSLLAQDVPLDEFKERHAVSAIVRAAPDDAGFSHAIRAAHAGAD